MTFPAILFLEDGTVCKGLGFGNQSLSVGEIVFNTSMSGYQEIITDPSYAKQIIAFTHPHIGNTGTNPEDNESENIYASGVVIKDLPSHYSNWRATESLESFLESKKAIGIANVDTRQLTAKLRDHGSLKACIVPDSHDALESAKKAIEQFSGLEGLDLAKEVTTEKSYQWDEGTWPNYQDVSSDRQIVAIDFGIKKNILRLLKKHVGNVTVVNAQISFDELKDFTKGFVKTQMAQYGQLNPEEKDLEDIVQRVLGNQDEAKRLQEQLMSQKLLNFYKGNITFKVKEVNYEEFVKEVYK